MKKLVSVHRGLRRLRHFRAMVRMGSAWSVALSVVLWALAVAFLLDFWIRMGRLERGILLLAVLAAVAWALTKYLLPAWRVRESDVDLALLVERQQGLHSDLVAALQFADGRRAQYGSAGLREAVVDCTAEASGGLDFLEGFSREQMLRRLAGLVVSGIAVVLPAVAFREHSAAFLNRLLLGSAHYPTRTIIERIESPTGEHVPYGRPVVFRVRAGGEVPSSGRVELRAAASDLAATIDLAPDPNAPAVFRGRLERILDDLSYRIYLGDAYTEPRELKIIPLPLVQVALDVTPPAYAAAKFRAAAERGRQTVAPEGSRVGVTVSADKRLLGGTIAVGDETFDLAARDGRLTLDRKDTPFERVAEPFRFKVQVVDQHSQSLERPISGVVQVTPDRPPRIAAAAVSRYVLPTASPMIMLKALDDYGVSKIVLHQTIHRVDANETEQAATIATPADRPDVVSIWHQLKLTPLDLTKGDRVSVHLEAVDYRGELPGKSGRSDPIVFLVTDREGLLKAMRKLDDRMVEKLDEIIRAQLGIGD